MQKNEEQFIVQIKININALLCQLCLKSYLNIDTKVHITFHFIYIILIFFSVSGSIASFSNSTNVITNPSYDGPPMHASRTNIVPDDMRGHLVWSQQI